MGRSKQAGFAPSREPVAQQPQGLTARPRGARHSLSLASYPQDIFNTRTAAAKVDTGGSAMHDDQEAFHAVDPVKQETEAQDSMNWLYTTGQDNDRTPRASDQDHYNMHMTEDFMQFGRAPDQGLFDAYTGLLSPQVSRENSGADSAAGEAPHLSNGPQMFSGDHRQYMNVQGDFKALHQAPASITPGLLIGLRSAGASRQTADFLSAPVRILARLLAPTSMRRFPDEDSQTYLNKSQVYGLSLADPEYQPRDRATLYRTTVKILFHDDDQKQRAAAFWSIWRDGRGTTEAVERKASAVRALEFDEAGSLRMTEKHKADKVSRPTVVAEAFDGFTVQWSPVKQAPFAQTMLALRCHFLSTDFSHSKGVRGVSLKLAVHTELVEDNDISGVSRSACLIKLFRDKGAERKAANDLSHIRKALQRLEDPDCKSQGGTANSAVIQKAHARRESDFQARVQHRRKRSNSVSSQSTIGAYLTDGFTRQDEISMYRDMLASIMPVTELRLGLEADDDMDLSFDEEVALSNVAPADALESQDTQMKPGKVSPAILYRPNIRLSPQPQLTTDNRPFLAADCDQNYVSPKPQKKPIRCLYFMQYTDAHSKAQQTMSPVSQGSPDMAGGAVLNQGKWNTGGSRNLGSLEEKLALPPLYRALYLFENTVGAFISAMTEKLRLDSEKHKIVRCVRENSRGIRILLEDEMLERMPDGQDMIVKLLEVGPGQSELVLFYVLA